MPHELVLDDHRDLKNFMFYPLLYFVYRRCRQDLKGTRQLIFLTMAVAVAGRRRCGDRRPVVRHQQLTATASAPPGHSAKHSASNRAGVFYAMFLPLLFAMAIFLRGNAWWRLAAIGGCVILAFAIMVTFSRQSYLIALVGIALLLVRRQHGAGRTDRGARRFPPSHCCPKAVVERVAATQQIQRGRRRRNSTSAPQSRFDIWAGAWKMWKDHPAGVGLHRFPQLYRQLFRATRRAMRTASTC